MKEFLEKEYQKIKVELEENKNSNLSSKITKLNQIVEFLESYVLLSQETLEKLLKNKTDKKNLSLIKGTVTEFLIPIVE